jgi:hypothetical protein
VTGEEATANYAVTLGDSGGLVFTVCGSNCRDAAGLVSGETGPGPNSGTLFFVSAPKILASFNVILSAP